MAVRKIAISLPEEVLRDVDRLAKKTKTSRSGCIARVLAEVSRANNQAEITEAIDRLFSDPKIAEEQRSTSELFLRAADPSFEDPEW